MSVQPTCFTICVLLHSIFCLCIWTGSNQDGIEDFFFICRQCSPSFVRILGEISQEPHTVAEGRRCDSCGTPYRTHVTGRPDNMEDGGAE